MVPTFASETQAPSENFRPLAPPFCHSGHLMSPVRNIPDTPNSWMSIQPGEQLANHLQSLTYILSIWGIGSQLQIVR